MIWMNKVKKREIKTKGGAYTITTDEAWLRMLNEERAKDNLGQVSCDLFEAVIDQLEKDWFDLVSLTMLAQLEERERLSPVLIFRSRIFQSN